ncbi:hypothetical protein FKP32DRAFT_143303 [Trametes sanguinea]|nr:hypothetical protein FKP32DRAFT_143303 [Trametes sanguinea]
MQCYVQLLLRTPRRTVRTNQEGTSSSPVSGTYLRIQRPRAGSACYPYESGNILRIGEIRPSAYFTRYTEPYRYRRQSVELRERARSLITCGRLVRTPRRLVTVTKLFFHCHIRNLDLRATSRTQGGRRFNDGTRRRTRQAWNASLPTLNPIEY